MKRRIPLFIVVCITALAGMGCVAKPEFTGRVKVLTYDADDPEYLTPDIASLIREADADVVCVQEARRNWCREFSQQFRKEYPEQLFDDFWLDLNFGFGYSKQPAFFSKYELRVIQYVPPVEKGWSNSWIVEAQTPAGPVRFANVRMGMLPGEVDAVLDVMKPQAPSIIAGEFLRENRNYAIRRANSMGYIDVLPRFDDKTPTWRVRQMLVHVAREQRDRILCSSHFEPVSARVLSTDKSDHSPVVAELKLVESAPRVAPRLWR